MINPYKPPNTDVQNEPEEWKEPLIDWYGLAFVLTVGVSSLIIMALISHFLPT